MNGNNAPFVPDRLSHRQLKAMLQSAQHETPSIDIDPASTPLTDDLSSWTTLTHALLESIAQQRDAIGQQHSAEQMMALGSFRTHLMLGLQALKAAKL